ncbi:hypothetical protein H2200_002605 [Cladophialophora chaetospira]|uniref:Uncharacterized protein n=1 Tax=Cladophialophora chaetospira TaxID=386627 RepID=A0AA39CNQ7_9EURO|nr:hypothetical protein H2200_002605 [Cladophialophora chaetospira]
MAGFPELARAVDTSYVGHVFIKCRGFSLRDTPAWLCAGSYYRSCPETVRDAIPFAIRDVFIMCRGFDFEEGHRCVNWIKYEEEMGYGEHIYYCPEHASQLELIERRRVYEHLCGLIDSFVQGKGEQDSEEARRTALASLALSLKGIGECGHSGYDTSLQVASGPSATSSAGKREQSPPDLDPDLLAAYNSMTLTSNSNDEQDQPTLDPALLAALDSLKLSSPGNTNQAGNTTTTTKEAPFSVLKALTLAANRVLSLLGDPMNNPMDLDSEQEGLEQNVQIDSMDWDVEQEHRVQEVQRDQMEWDPQQEEPVQKLQTGAMEWNAQEPGPVQEVQSVQAEVTWDPEDPVQQADPTVLMRRRKAVPRSRRMRP